MPVGVLAETLPFWGAEGSYLESPVGMFSEQGDWVQRNASLLLASVEAELAMSVNREEAFLWWTPKIVWSLFFFLYLQEIGAHKDELSFEQFHLFYKKLMFEQQKSVR